MLPPEDEVMAQVLVADGRVVGELLAGALEQDLALEQQIGPVGDAERLGALWSVIRMPMFLLLRL